MLWDWWINLLQRRSKRGNYKFIVGWGHIDRLALVPDLREVDSTIGGLLGTLRQLTFINWGPCVFPIAHCGSLCETVIHLSWVLGTQWTSRTALLLYLSGIVGNLIGGSFGGIEDLILAHSDFVGVDRHFRIFALNSFGVFYFWIVEVDLQVITNKVVLFQFA
jgi:hypothetical protein